MYKKYFIIAIIILVIAFNLFYIIGTTKITVHFKELEPFKHHLPVYYKGFRLGHTTKVYPSKDYKSTYVDLRIVMKNLRLPANTTATLRRKDKKDYIELIYPNAPYIESLRHKDIIEGNLGINFEHYLQDQAQNGGLDEIKANVNRTISSAGETFEALTEMIQVTTSILEDIRPTIKDTVENLNLASQDLANSSYTIRNSLEQGYIDKSLYNIEETTKNLVLTTKNMNGITNSVNNNSINYLNCLIKNLNIVVNNINEIIIGLGNTLKKRFGGFRLFFGKTIS